jgi:hypothetical protein
LKLTMREQAELLFGPSWRTTSDGDVYRSRFASAEERETVWTLARTELIERAVEWCPRMPARRPWAYWFYDAGDEELDWLAGEDPRMHERLEEARERISWAWAARPDT